MKILIHGNTPNVMTGYGVQARYLADRLTRAGYEVAFSSTYGQQFGVGTWTSPGGHDVRLYPNGIYTNSPDTILAHAEHFFEGDPKAGWIITLIDVWSLGVRAAELAGYQVAAWTPVDHFPAPPEVAGFLARSGSVPVAMSRFGERQLVAAGLDPAYIPLAVDTNVFKPTPTVDAGGVDVSGRELFGLPDDAFVVGMVAMNKDPLDRKGFNEAFRAFGRFWQDNQDAVLFVHTDRDGAAGGLNLPLLAAHASVPAHAIVFSDQYAYRLGLPAEMMAAAYSAMDVLLAPSHGEGFCVPLIEAAACGVPAVVTDFSAQSELAGSGWKVGGQPLWDAAQAASYMMPFVDGIVSSLAVARADLDDHGAELAAACVGQAAAYDADRVFEDCWVPFLRTLEPAVAEPKPKMETVDIILPLMRPELLDALAESVDEDRANLIVVHDTDTKLPIRSEPWNAVATCEAHTTYAEKVNAGVEKSTADWVLVVGDDVEFTPGWFDRAAEVSGLADVVGTNDSEPGRVRNPDVAAGRHADHFFIRRSYIDDVGSSLDGPGVTIPTAYFHWFSDREVIQLAKARGVYVHAGECRIVHHHPGYDGDETAREADVTYMSAVGAADDDNTVWLTRAPLIEGHRVTRVHR